MNDSTYAPFEREKRASIEAMGKAPALKKLSTEWMVATAPYRYSYHFSWMGRPIIQYPQDMVAMQEIIWQVRPDLIIETGVAHGGSLVFYASLLELMGKGQVVGIDVEIRQHNREAIENHPMAHRISLVEGSSVNSSVVARVGDIARGKQRVLVALDSNHSHAHVLEELRVYAPLVNRDSYLVVFDTIIEDFPAGSFPDRPWDRGSNPKTAVEEFLRENDRFIVDDDMDSKLLISATRGGYLKCVKQ